MSFREYYLLSGPDRPSDRQECEIETLWNARESYGLCPWHCPDAHTVLVQLNTLSFPKSVITYTPQINMEIPPKLTKEDKQVRDYIKESGCKNIDKFLNPILKWHRQVARSRSEHCSNRWLRSWKIKLYQLSTKGKCNTTPQFRTNLPFDSHALDTSRSWSTKKFSSILSVWIFMICTAFKSTVKIPFTIETEMSRSPKVIQKSSVVMQSA